MPVKPGRTAPRHPLLHDPAAVTHRRIDAELTLTELAARVGCALSTLSEIEGGTRSPSLPLLRRIAAALGCTVRDLRPAPAASSGQVA